ncbi:MAG TPA: hypothetical protein VKT52_04255, partial [Ktedonobacterales bacterium]|nr:hypothetical protein [Ktedonobacterales bacterium]
LMAALLRIEERVLNLEHVQSVVFEHGKAIIQFPEPVHAEALLVLEGEQAAALRWWMVESHGAQDLMTLYRATHPAPAPSYDDLVQAAAKMHEFTGGISVPLPEEIADSEIPAWLDRLRSEYRKCTGGEAASLQQMEKLAAMARELGKPWHTPPKLSAYGASRLINQWAVELTQRPPAERAVRP